MVPRNTPARAALAACLISGLIACGDGATFVDDDPPATTGGQGGFDPGPSPTGASTGAYGYGANSGQSNTSTSSSGSGGAGGEAPPECADELKRCAHAFTYDDAGASTVEVRGDFAPGAWEAGVPMVKAGSTWTAEVPVPWDVDVQYRFFVDGANWVTDPANPNQVDDGFGGKNSLLAGETCPDDFTCTTAQLGDFDWRDAVLYFVLVDRFVDGNPSNNGPSQNGVDPPAAYRGGDWVGLKSKIEEGYFNELGVNALWLSVPFDNADVPGPGDDGHLYSAYHGYWPRDLDQVESRLGTEAELKAVVDAAHAAGIKVVVDYAMNHVHESSPLYAQHPDWFWPVDAGGRHCVCGDQCSWDGDDGRRCWFTSYLPDFNFTVPAARDYSVNNAITWAQTLGLDGFRLDAVKHVETSWLTDLRARVRSDIETVTQQHFYMVGETFTGDRGLIGSYVEPTTKLDGQFDFPLRASILQSIVMRQSPMSDLDGFLSSNVTFYGSGVMSTFVGNHDIPRTIHFAEDAPRWNDPWANGKEVAWSNTPSLPGGMKPFERMANAFTLLFTIPGVPLIYYGDEVGMAGAGDPDNRRMMQWGGYANGQLFLKDHLAALTAIRAAHPALRRGSWASLGANADTMAFRMKDGADEVIVAINRGDGDATVGNLPSQSFVDALSGDALSGPSVSVPARSARVLVAP